MTAPAPPAAGDTPPGDHRERGGAHPAGGRAQNRTLIARRRWPRRVLIGANVLALLSLLFAGAAYGYVAWRLGEISRIPILGLSPAGKSKQSQPDGSNIAPFTLLVVGSDTRAIAGGRAFGGTQDVGGQRSDSIILLRVTPKTGSLSILSIPRDTLVPIPGYGVTRVNVAFNSGNPQLLVKVLKQDFGIEVNHYAGMNFDTFRQIADAVGGVKVWFPAPARDIESNLRVPAGCVNLTGNQALAFVRSRNYQYYLDGEWHYQMFPESDLARIQRQQAFAKLVAQKAGHISPTNPVELNSLIGSITTNLKLDNTFSNAELLSLAKTYRHASLTKIPEFTYPTVNSTTVPGALDPLPHRGKAMVAQWLAWGEPVAHPRPAPHKATTTTGPTTTTTVVPAQSVSIEVSNGSGATGQAGATALQLKQLGYRATVAADQQSTLSRTQIRYAPDSLAAAKQLQSQLATGATLVEGPALSTSPFNLELITGTDFTGVSGSQGAAAPVASTTTTTAPPSSGTTPRVFADASSFVNGQYIPPGRVPGQRPVKCP
ncbi:MAG: LCP family protein [Acidimicrobiaceae bacterium]|nr:LCP family protein [Acidimicrobiaceae bacterium]